MFLEPLQGPRTHQEAVFLKPACHAPFCWQLKARKFWPGGFSVQRHATGNAFALGINIVYCDSLKVKCLFFIDS
ncbi:hypothetical protein SynPROSU1_01305 [Synechococcus sp. PROS-U-1]|nr:hypothetical protein SynPROSU1_01305 [Synechococcus sp. PROS-U-1]